MSVSVKSGFATGCESSVPAHPSLASVLCDSDARREEAEHSEHDDADRDRDRGQADGRPRGALLRLRDLPRGI